MSVPPAREIERKFRLAVPPDASVLGPGVPIIQGYLMTEDGEERIRRKGDLCTWTVKSEGDVSRDEFEVEIPEWVFDTLWPRTSGRRIEKVRHTAPWRGLTLEVDVYQGALGGLVVMECEFPDEAAARRFTLPGWAAGALEVTMDRRFKNRALATDGVPDPLATPK